MGANKKLHFEVAIIKAIQSLGQATLDEVIEKLGELRDGRARPPGAPPTKPVATAADRGETKLVAQKAGVTAPAYSQTRVEEKPTTVDSEKIWQAVLAKIPAQKGFVRNSASAAHVLGVEGRNFKLGFAPGDKPMMDILGTPANRKFVETLLHEISEKDWTLKLTLSEELASGAQRPKRFAFSGFQRRTINPGSYRTIQRPGHSRKVGHDRRARRTKELMNLNKLMKQAQKMQEQMAKTQAELEQKTVEVSAAGGKVKVTANGAGDIIAIKIDKEVVDPNDVEFLEEIVLNAVKQAIEQGKALAQSEMTKITGGLGGMGIPGLQ